MPWARSCAGHRPPPTAERPAEGLYTPVMDATPGILALVGGGEWQEGCDFDAGFLTASGSDQVLVLPTAGAYEHPEQLVVRAGEWFAHLGGKVEGLMVVNRSDAENDGAADIVRRARMIYLAGSSPMHIRSVLKNSAVWHALVAAWGDGAVVVGSSGAAMALTDPMVDARGGGLTIGLGLLRGVAVVPHFGDAAEDGTGEKLHRSVLLAPRGTPVVGIPERTALVRDPGGAWRSVGAGSVTVYLDGAKAADGLAALPA
jgi:cyanophycinase